MLDLALLVPLVTNLGLMAALAVAYAVLMPHLEKTAGPFDSKPRLTRSLVVGLIFGVAGAVAMYLPVEFAPGIIFDVRAIPLLLSGVFGGPLAAIFAGASIGGVRIAIGGAGTVPALVAASGFVCMSIGLWHLRRTNPRFGVHHLALAGLLCILPILLGVSLLGLEMTKSIVNALAIPIMVTHTAGCYIVGWLLLSEDRRRKTEEQLRVARVAADQANDAKSQFLAQISHELRTPMSAIVGSLELLSMERLKSEHHEMLEVTRRSASNLVKLLNDLLDLSKIEAGRMVFTEHQLNVQELLNDLQILYRKANPSDAVTLSLRIAPEVPEYIQVDGHRLKQILNNLIGNALKFTREGEVELTADIVPTDRLSQDRVSTQAKAQTMRIVVRDTGIGIPVDRQEAVFEAFEQADARIDHEFGGTGLGLPISRRLARAMGGDLTLSSVEQVGTSMTLLLPFTAVDRQRAGEDTARPEPSLSELVSAKPFAGKRILLAEDVEASRMVIDRMLTALGAEVIAVPDGAQAVSKAAEGVDIILMDMQMPVIDGPEATRRIRALSGTVAETPIFALTADATQVNKRRYHAAGLDGVLTKPVDWGELVAVVASFRDSDTASIPQPSISPASLGDSASRTNLSVLTVAKSERWNRETIESLELSLGHQTVVDLLSQLPTSISLCLEDIKTALQNDTDFQKQVWLSAHSLKGAAANLGFDRLRTLAEQLETSADYSETQLAAASLEEELEEITALIETYVATPYGDRQRTERSVSGAT